MRGGSPVGIMISLVAASLLTACDATVSGPPQSGSTASADRSESSGDNATSKDRASSDDAASQNAQAEAAPQTERPANRLAKETSPYLLLHAHNPVDWYPWGEEALAKAAAEKKLIFLSIGYSSCYWCHVMERESFMDEEVAAYLNEHFVCIKVDREERPDLDEIYMTAVQMLGRQGGWPLTVFLLPDAKPFYGATYLPPRDRQVAGPDGEPQTMTGLMTVLPAVVTVWTEKPDEIQTAGNELASMLEQTLPRRSAAIGPFPDATVLDEVERALVDQFDPEYGGFGYSAVNPGQPKFPEPSNLGFLLARMRDGDAEPAGPMLITTLEKMAGGGIRDHLGGGFHRYSTDRYWRVPHFEKMLYDNALLTSVYAEAYAATGREDFREVCEEILAFVDRELSNAEGGFYSALDAETDADEGAYYVWTPEELQSALSDEEYELLAYAYGIDGEPNFEGRWVLELPRPLRQSAAEREENFAEFSAKLASVQQKLLAVRATRKRPLTDTKVLTSWNGLMIRAFADAGRFLDRSDYRDRAAAAAEFLRGNLMTNDGRLLRTYADGQAKLNAYLDDYAFYVAGLISLHRATGEAQWLELADAVMAKQIELFWDEQGGGFFFTSSDHEQLLARSKNPADSAIPSGNAVAVANLVYLAGAADRPEYREHAKRTIQAFAGFFKQAPSAMPQMATSLSEYLASEAANKP